MYTTKIAAPTNKKPHFERRCPPMLAQIIQLAVSRQREYLADASAGPIHLGSV